MFFLKANNEEEAPSFRSMVRCGPGETWTHHTDKQKFEEFGWRDTTKESNYENETLIGNWNEERFDIEKLKKEDCLPSRFTHYFQTTYQASHSSEPHKVPAIMKHFEHEVRAYPGHQPELDPPELKEAYKSWSTTQRVSYIDPSVRRQVLLPPVENTPNENTQQKE